MVDSGKEFHSIKRFFFFIFDELGIFGYATMEIQTRGTTAAVHLKKEEANCFVDSPIIYWVRIAEKRLNKSIVLLKRKRRRVYDAILNENVWYNWVKTKKFFLKGSISF